MYDKQGKALKVQAMSTPQAADDISGRPTTATPPLP
jgi:hypothetical protein